MKGKPRCKGSKKGKSRNNPKKKNSASKVTCAPPVKMTSLVKSATVTPLTSLKITPEYSSSVPSYASSSSPFKDPLTIEIESVVSKHAVLSRVSRWKTKNPEEIRQFKDQGHNGHTIYRYRDLSNDEIQKFRERHYLPVLDCILEGKILKRDYVRSTSRGNALMCDMIYSNGTVEYGHLYFGIIKNKIYHCYFEPMVSSTSSDVDVINSEIPPEELSDDGFVVGQTLKW